MATIGDDGSAGYDFDIAWDVGAGVHAPAMLVHTGSIAAVLEPGASAVDTIGAGDSFMSGLLVALHDADLLGRSRESRLRALDADQLRGLREFAASCSAVTVSRPGADPPRRDRVTPTA